MWIIVVLIMVVGGGTMTYRAVTDDHVKQTKALIAEVNKQ